MCVCVCLFFYWASLHVKTKILVFPAPMVEVKYWALCSEGSGGSIVLLKALCDVLAPPVVVGQRGL